MAASVGAASVVLVGGGAGVGVGVLSNCGTSAGAWVSTGATVAPAVPRKPVSATRVAVGPCVGVSSTEVITEVAVAGSPSGSMGRIASGVGVAVSIRRGSLATAVGSPKGRCAPGGDSGGALACSLLSDTTDVGVGAGDGRWVAAGRASMLRVAAGAGTADTAGTGAGVGPSASTLVDALSTSLSGRGAASTGSTGAAGPASATASGGTAVAASDRWAVGSAGAAAGGTATVSAGAGRSPVNSSIARPIGVRCQTTTSSRLPRNAAPAYSSSAARPRATSAPATDSHRAGAPDTSRLHRLPIRRSL